MVTVEGQDRTGVGRDEAMAEIANMPGVKDVVENISVAPVSMFDDGIRLRAMRAIYRDPVLSRYAMDPAKPIRIIVANGHVTLYGAVDSAMDKNIAGIRAGQDLRRVQRAQQTGSCRKVVTSVSGDQGGAAKAAPFYFAGGASSKTALVRYVSILLIQDRVLRSTTPPKSEIETWRLRSSSTQFQTIQM